MDYNLGIYGKYLLRIENFLTTSKAEKIHICDIGYIAKCEFKILGINNSPKGSGNRIIVYINEEKGEATILLLYAKADIVGNHETTWWEKEVKSNYPDIAELFLGL